jgi:hypothetical protein
MSTADPAMPARPDFWSRLGGFIGRLLGFLLRLVFVLLLAVAIGAGVYYGLPWVYQALVQPVQTHSSQIQDLYNKVEGVRAADEASQAAQNDRLSALEAANDVQRQQVEAAETEAADLRAALEQAQADAQTAQDAATADREALAAQVADLQSQLDTQAAANADVQDAVAELQPATSDNAARNTALQQQLTLLQLENALLHARLQVNAQNLGEARTILTGTVAAMQAFVETPGVFDSDDQETLTVRLRAAASLIEADPAAALTDFDSVWAEMDRIVNKRS